MKKVLSITIVLFVLASLCSLYAQKIKQEPESLIGKENAAFFMKPEFKLTSIDGKASELAGLQLGPSFGRKLYLGVGGYSLVNSVKVDNDHVKFSAFDLWYIGGVVEYNFLSDQLVHFSLGCLIGGGNAKGKVETQARSESESSAILVVEPNANLMVNIMPTLALGVSCGYRFVGGSDIGTISSSDLSGISGSIFLRWQEE